MENNNEEMDLIALLRWIFGGVKNVFGSCLHFCGAILKITYREKYLMLFFMNKFACRLKICYICNQEKR